MNDETREAIKLLHKNALMGVYSVKQLLPKANSKNLKEYFEKQLDYYSHKLNRLEDRFFGIEDENKAGNLLGKAAAGMDIAVKTAVNPDDSKLAELMIDGINMGIKELEKRHNSDEQIASGISREIDAVLQHEKRSLETLREYL